LKFEDFLKKNQEEPAQGMEIGGSFSCQTCNETVDEAEWFQPEKILRWVCSAKHLSYIEGFSL
jgi:hypothetical protein